MSEKIEKNENKNNIEEDSKKEIPKKTVKKTNSTTKKATSKNTTTAKKKVENKKGETKSKIDKEKKAPTKKNGTTANKSTSTKKTAPTKTSTTKKNIKAANNNIKRAKKEDSKINQLIKEQLENVERIEEIDKIQKEKKSQKKKIEIDKEKISKEIENAQKMSKEEKRKIRKKLLKNILIGLAIIMYYIFLGAGFYNIEEMTYIVDLKVFSLLMLAVTIILFENAYNKDNDEIAITGIEFLSIAIITLILIYIYILYKNIFLIVIGTCLSVTLIYYLIKSITIYVKEKLKWEKTISDVKKIVSEG